MSFLAIMQQPPHAVAYISGSTAYPDIKGVMNFYQTNFGSLIAAEIMGLPTSEDPCKSPVFAFHIHEGNTCKGNMEDSFADAMTHYNPKDCPHPYHSGDMPPLFGNDGYAFSAFLTNRFTVEEIIGRTVIIHANPDDFTTQPSGNSGTKIACGVIVSFLCNKKSTS